MNAIILRYTLVICMLTAALSASSQCKILHRISPDGSMMYYIEPVNFYWTKAKSLKGGVETDKENYYLELQPSPFPEKPLGNKLKDEAEIKLSNDSVYRLEHFDTRYLDQDSVMQLLYLIDKKNLNDFLHFEAISVKINMEGAEGIRTYVFKLHKGALREQLNCFLLEDE
jgi:hypothetical protein